jgi:ABC-type antimicrobial peptide transport system permease subunit
MISEYLKMALSSIRSAKFRSGLTMFGIVVGVSSVVTIVSLGEGVRQQITAQSGEIGESLIVVRPGRQAEARIISLDTLRNFANGAGSLSEKDWKDTAEVEGVEVVAPVGSISGIASYKANGNEYSGTIITSTEDLPQFLNQEIEYGSFFSSSDSKNNVAIIGRDVAEVLFEENVPIGKKLTIRGVDYLVQGVFEQQNSGTFAAINVNNSIILPYESAADVSDNVQILQLFVKAQSPETVSQTAENIRSTLIENHAGQEDFTVLEKEEALEATNEIFYQLTVFIAGVAFISFIVGGIGIMNIMFATVSERTHEIGIRKAVGATNRQILGQFVMEAVVLSVVGGLLGIGVAYLANGIIRVTTDLQPVTTLYVVVIVFALSALTGIISGLLPAAQAARKDAIAALRNGQ